MRILLTSLVFFLVLISSVIAQDDTILKLDGFDVVSSQVDELELRNEESQRACAACGLGMATLGGVIIAIIALNIALLVWVARDAKNRSMDSSVLWMMLVMSTGFIGLIIYMFSRPQGQLLQCASCNGRRLAMRSKCPHCQNP